MSKPGAEATVGPTVRVPPGPSEHVLVYVLIAVAVVVVGLGAEIVRPLAPAVPKDPVAADLLPAHLLTGSVGPLGRYAAEFANWILTPLAILAVGLTRPGRRMVDGLAGDTDYLPRRTAIVGLFVIVVANMVTAPVDFYFNVLGPHGNEGVLRWLTDWLPAKVPYWGMAGIGAMIVSWAIHRWPVSWPWRVGVGAAGFMALITLSGPWFIDPLLVDHAPVPQGEVRSAIGELLVRAGAEDTPIMLGTGGPAAQQGAYVIGIGNARQVVLVSSLVGFPPEQVQFVVAHELSHASNGDNARVALFTGAWMVGGALVLSLAMGSRRVQEFVGARSMEGPRMAVVAVTVGALITSVAAPVHNLVSRRAEATADYFGLEMAGNPQAALGIFQFLVLEAGVDPRPPAWYQATLSTYPTPIERLNSVVGFAREHGLPVPGTD